MSHPEQACLTNIEQSAVRSMRQRALSASWWTIASQPLQLAFRFAQSVIVARFIAPEHFGIMALVGLLLNGLVMFSDIGTGPAAIRSPHGDNPDFLRTIWTLSILRGGALWLASVVAAVPFAWIYSEPAFLLLVPVSGSNILISSFGTTAGVAFSRRIDLRTPTLFHLATLPISFLIAIGMAYWLRDAWALVWSSVLNSFVMVILGHLFLPGIPHRFCLQREYVREIYSFGRWVFVGTIFMFIAMQADKLMLAKLVDMRSVGVYGIGLVLAQVPMMLIGALAGSVLFPVFSEQFRDHPAQLAPRALKARRLLLTIGLMLCLGVFVIAPHFFHLLYLPDFWDAGWMTQFMIVSIWMTMLYTTSGHAVLAIGDSRSNAAATAFNAVMTVVGCIGGFWLAGIPGFILGYAIGTLAGECVLALRLRKAGIGFGRQDVWLTLLGTIAILSIVLAGEISRRILPNLPYGSEAVGLMIIGVIGWKIFPEFRHAIRRG